MSTKKGEKSEPVTFEDIRELSFDLTELAGEVKVVAGGRTINVTRSRKRETRRSTAMGALARSLYNLVRKRDDEDRKAVKEYLMAISSGIDPSEIPLERYIPIRIYLKDGKNKDNVRQSVNKLTDSMGFTVNDEYDPEIGSWFQKIIGKSKEAITNEELIERLAKAERALELAHINKVQSEIDKNLGEAASKVIESIKDEDEAAIQLSSLLIVKHKDSKGKSKIGTRVLTQKELIYLEKNPEIIEDPNGIIDVLNSIRKTSLLSQERKSGG